MGYQFNRYLSIESGLSRYPSAVRNYDSSRGLLPVAGFVGNSKISDIYSIDLMGAFRMPIGQRFFIGAQLGGAAIHFNYAAMNATNGAASVLSWNPSSAWFIAPKVGLKLGMALNPTTSVFASSSYIYSVNGNDTLFKMKEGAKEALLEGAKFHFESPRLHRDNISMYEDYHTNGTSVLK